VVLKNQELDVKVELRAAGGSGAVQIQAFDLSTTQMTTQSLWNQRISSGASVRPLGCLRDRLLFRSFARTETLLLAALQGFRFADLRPDCS
jgi:hypothetical protein